MAKVRLDDSDLGSNLESLGLDSKSDVGFLLSVGADESVDTSDLGAVKGSEGVLDLNFVGGGLDEEGEDVAVLHLLHDLVGSEGADQDGVGVVRVSDLDVGAHGLENSRHSPQRFGLGEVELGLGPDGLGSVLDRLGNLAGGLLSFGVRHDGSLNFIILRYSSYYIR